MDPSQGFLPYTAQKVSRLPKFLQFYRPVINFGSNLVQQIQNKTGCPWWIAIPSLTILVRVSILPAFYLQLKATKPLSRAMPDIRLMTDLYTPYTLKSTYYFTQHFFQTMKQLLYRSHKVKIGKATMYGLIQFPHFLTYVWCIRNLCAINPALETGGAFWFTNLAQADPYCILPLLSCSLTYITLNRGITSQNAESFLIRIKSAIQFFIIASFPITCNWPAGVFCYWTASASFGLLQSFVLTSRWFLLKTDPELQEEMRQILMKNMPPEQCENMTEHVMKGFPQLKEVREAEVAKSIEIYLKQQEKYLKK